MKPLNYFQSSIHLSTELLYASQRNFVDSLANKYSKPPKTDTLNQSQAILRVSPQISNDLSDFHSKRQLFQSASEGLNTVKEKLLSLQRSSKMLLSNSLSSESKNILVKEFTSAKQSFSELEDELKNIQSHLTQETTNQKIHATVINTVNHVKGTLDSSNPENLTAESIAKIGQSIQFTVQQQATLQSQANSYQKEAVASLKAQSKINQGLPINSNKNSLSRNDYLIDHQNNFGLMMNLISLDRSNSGRFFSALT